MNNTGQGGGTPGADIDVTRVWDLTYGDPGLTVAILDTGVDQSHPDLSANTWKNPGESGEGREKNGVDDDHDGYVDDGQGWDWVNGDNFPADDNGHGTAVAGIAAAQGNDKSGVAGVAWHSKIMALKVLDKNMSGTLANAGEAANYAAQKGARIVNMSFGTSQHAAYIEDVISRNPGTLFITGAGNDGKQEAYYPCALPEDNLICVAATDRNDNLMDISNFNVTDVDLGAPGDKIRTTWPDISVVNLSETSAAVPHVSGAALLLWSLIPNATPNAVKSAIMNGGKELPTLDGKTVSGKRLDVVGALYNLPIKNLIQPEIAAKFPLLYGYPTFTATPGLWSSPTASISYQWLRCDKNGNTCRSIQGAFKNKYTARKDDVGYTLTVEVGAVNAISGATSRSKPTAVIKEAFAVPKWLLN